MGELKLKREVFHNALASLEEVLAQIKNEQYYSFDQARDSAIKRFEYTLEMFWKFLRIYLQEELLIDVEGIFSPRSVFKASVQAKILSRQEFKECIQMVEDRNRTAHAYQESVAEKVYDNIVAYAHLMHTIVNNLDK